MDISNQPEINNERQWIAFLDDPKNNFNPSFILNAKKSINWVMHPNGVFVGDYLKNSTLPMNFKFPDMLHEIQGSFYGCIFSGPISIPDSMKKINNNVFENVEFQNILELPKSLSINSEFTWFKACKFHKEVLFPSYFELKGVNHSGLFLECEFFDTLKLPQLLLKETTVFAFDVCKFHKEVLFPLSFGLTENSSQLFHKCEFIDTLNLPQLSLINVRLALFNFCKFHKEVLFQNYFELGGTEYSCLFLRCEFFDTLKLPQSSSVGSKIHVFDVCKFHKEVLFPASFELADEDSRMFSECEFFDILKLPQSLLIKASLAVFKACKFHKEVLFPPSFELMGNDYFFLFHKCEFFDTLKLPQFELIGIEKTFEACKFHKEVLFPNHFEFKKGEWENDALPHSFHECEFLGNLQLPQLFSIETESAFFSCKFHKEVLFPPSFELMGKLTQTSFCFLFLKCEFIETLQLPHRRIGFQIATCKFHKEVLFPKSETNDEILPFLFHECEFLKK